MTILTVWGWVALLIFFGFGLFLTTDSGTKFIDHLKEKLKRKEELENINISVSLLITVTLVATSILWPIVLIRTLYAAVTRK